MSNLVLIDSRITDIDCIISSLANNTHYLVFDYFADSFLSLTEKIPQNNYDSVAIIQHNYNLSTYQLVESMPPAKLTNIKVASSFNTWLPFIEFTTSLKQKVNFKYIDLLACDIWVNTAWNYIIKKIRSEYDIYIRASTDITGRDGNFILESDNVNLIGLYFTNEIHKYQFNFYYASNGGREQWYFDMFGYSNPTIDGQGGTVYAQKYTNFFGKILQGNNSLNTVLTTDISNVVYISTNNNTCAALKSDGTVVTWGGYNYGGNSSEVSSELYDIEKIVSSTYSFTALRKDKTAISWGDANITYNIRTSTSENIIRSTSVDLTNCVDVVSTRDAYAALKTNGSVVTWGNKVTGGDSSSVASYISSNVKKLYSCSTTFFALKHDNSLIAWGNYHSNTFSNSGSPIVEVFPLYISCVVLREDNTITVGTSDTVSYTIPTGVTITRFHAIGNLTNNYAIILSNSDLVMCINSFITVVNNVTDFISNDPGAYAYITNGTLVCGGDYRYGGDIAHPSHGLPEPYTNRSLSGIAKLYSSSQNLFALKSDGTILAWGINTWLNFMDLFTLTNVVYMWGFASGVVTLHSDGTLHSTSTYAESPTVNTLQYPQDKTIIHYNFLSGAAILEIPITEKITTSVDIPMANSAFTLTYKNVNQAKMAFKGRTYGLYNGNTQISTFVSTSYAYTYVFPNVLINNVGFVTLTVKDITNGVNSALSMFSFIIGIDDYIAPIPSPPLPTITSVTAGNKNISIQFTQSVLPNSQPLTGYTYSLDGGVTYNLSKRLTSPILITGLNNNTTYSNILLNTIPSNSQPISISTVKTWNVPSAPAIISGSAGNKYCILDFVNGTSDAAVEYYKYSLDGITYNKIDIINNTLQLQIYGLTNGQTYNISMKSVSSIGESLPSNSYTITIPDVEAPSPIIENVTTGTNVVYLHFTNTETANIVGYRVLLNDGSTIDLSQTTSPLQISGLPYGNTYYFYLKTMFSNGKLSKTSNISKQIVHYTLPNAPTFTSYTKNKNFVLLNITNGNLNGSGNVVGYKYSINGGSTYILSKSTQSPIKISGLTTGVTYSVKIATITSRVSTINDASHNYLTVSNVTSYKSPSNLLVTNVVPDNKKVTIHFTLQPSIETPILYYKYQLNYNPKYYITSQTTSPLTIFNLTNNINYDITLISVSDAGESAPYTVTNIVPLGIPNTPIITSVTQGYKSVSIYFDETVNSGNSTIGHRYSLGSGYTTLSNPTVSLTSPIVLTGLTNNTTYKISLIAYNSTGNSYVSNIVSVAPGLPNPPVITTVSQTDTSVIVNFTSDTSGNGPAIFAYHYRFAGTTRLIRASQTSSPIVLSKWPVGVSQRVILYAENMYGKSAPSLMSDYITSSAKPSTITISNVITEYGNATTSNAIVTFVPPVNNGSPITEYYWRLNDETLDRLATYILPNYSATHMALRLTGLPYNTNYTVRVFSKNSMGNSTVSAASLPVKLKRAVPDKIVVIIAYTLESKLWIRFYEPLINGQTLQYYKYSLNNGPYVTATSITKDPRIGTVNVSIDISANVDYVANIVATNEVGDSLPSLPTSVVRFVSLPPSSGPYISTVVGNKNVATVTFKNPRLQGTPITKYKYTLNNIEYDYNILGTTMILPDLSYNIPYTLHMKAVTAYGNSPNSNSVTFTLKSVAPNRPAISNLQKANNVLKINLYANYVTGVDIQYYLYSLNNGLTYQNTLDTSVPINVSTGLVRGTTYTVLVKAVNDAGQSAASIPRTIVW